jgi:hypothetical protein
MKPRGLNARYLRRQATMFRFRVQTTPDPDEAAEYWNIADWYDHVAVDAKPKGSVEEEIYSPV